MPLGYKRALTILAGALFVPLVFAFKPSLKNGHDAITFEALASMSHTVSGQTVRFSPAAILEIIDSNIQTDHSISFLFPERHFDNDQLSNGNGFIGRELNDIVAVLKSTPPDGKKARSSLGAALHAIQDFFAHSNWVELNEIGTNLPSPAFGAINLPDPTASDQICEANKSTPRPSSTVLGTGHFDFLLCLAPSGKCSHGPCPGIPGIHKDDQARLLFPKARTAALAASIGFLNRVLSHPDITANPAAIYALMGVKPSGVPAARSALGMVIDDTGSMSDEISQVQAAVQQIVNGVAGTARQPSEFLLVRFGDPDVGPFFHTQDSNAYLNRVLSLTANLGGDCPELSMTALLQAIGASQQGATLFLFTDDQAKDASLVLHVINAAVAKRIQIITVYSTIGGAGCPNSPVDPAYLEIAKATGGLVYAAQPTQIGMAGSILRNLISGNQAPILASSGLFTTTAAGKIPADSFKTSLVPNESASVAGTPANQQGETRQFPPGAQIVSTEERSVPPGVVPALVSQPVVGPLNFSIPADVNTQRLVIAGSVEANLFGRLFRPSGSVVTFTEPGITLTVFGNGFVIEINNPETGSWTLQLGGLGFFFANAWVESSLQIGSVDFVRMAGRAEHEALFPLPGFPVATAAQTIMVRMLGSVTNVTLRCVSETGSTLLTVPMSFDPDGQFWLATLNLPSVPFRLVMGGTSSGAAYSRLSMPLITVNPVEILPVNIPEYLLVGRSTRLGFALINHGPGDSFLVALRDNFGFTITPPVLVSLATNASSNVFFDVAAPASLPSLTEVDFSVAAKSLSNPAVSNGATFSLDALVPFPAPSLTSIAPGSVLAGGPSLDVTVRGSGFVPGALLLWNGLGRTTTWVSANELRVAISAADVAAAAATALTVVNPNPNAGVSSALAFSVMDFALAASPSSSTVRAGQSASYLLSVNPLGGVPFTNPVSSFQCAGLPALATCAFSPASVTPGSSPTSVTLTIATTAAGMMPPTRVRPPSVPRFPLYVIWLLMAAALTIAFFNFRQREVRSRWSVAALLLIIGFQLSCGGGSTSPSTSPAPRTGTPVGNSTIVVTGSSGGLQHSVTVTLAVQ